jgi:hypothetical protein
MNCHSVQHKISAFIDGMMPADEDRKMSLHLSRCEECARLRDQLQQVQVTLRSLPISKPPGYLTTMLRVTASRERARQLAGTGFRATLRAWASKGQLWADNLMRPLALPLAGGLVSAIVLLGMLVPTFYVRQDRSKQDVPFGLSTEATMKSMSPFGFVDEDLAVIVKVDEQGRMIDYSIPGGQHLLKDPDLRRGIENALLFSEFSPARNAFGQPIRGPIRLYLRRSQVVVKG